MSRARRALRTSVAAVAIAAALFTATACSEAQQAIDCVKLGQQLANDVSSLQNVLNDPQAASDALDHMSSTLTKAAGDVDSQDVKNAINDMIQQVDTLSRQIADKETPSPDVLGLLSSSAKAIGSACTS
jgi:hypothetical protein